jgi:hypothetical protein
MADVAEKNSLLPARLEAEKIFGEGFFQAPFAQTRRTLSA